MEFIDLKSQYRVLRDSIDARIQAVLNHGCYIMGPEVKELEQRLAQFTGAKHCVTVSSGTDALLIALMALGVKPGDEVITTAFSFIATAEVMALLGVKPVFVDIEAETCNIDAGLIEEKIGPRTRAIIPVSLYGQTSDMDDINAIAERHGLAVIEDGAQSLGATYRGRKSGCLSTIGCTSFFPTKPLGCYGDGGAIFTSDDTLADAMRELRVHGQSRRYEHSRIGVAGRMDTLQCAVVLAKLDRFEWELEARRSVADLYDRCLGDGIEKVRLRPDRSSAYAQYTVMLKNRETVRLYLHDLGIPTAVHYPKSIPQQAAYRDPEAIRACPVAAAMAERVVSLPMDPYIDEAAVKRVAAALLRGVTL
jgi:UDP-2-acetamido-2-deoxy-ribo-hexuluronate aminotransferase